MNNSLPSLPIEESRPIRLTEAESRKLAEAFSNPPKEPTPAFQKALQAYKEKVRNGALRTRLSDRFPYQMPNDQTNAEGISGGPHSIS